MRTAVKTWKPEEHFYICLQGTYAPSGLRHETIEKAREEASKLITNQRYSNIHIASVVELVETSIPPMKTTTIKPKE